MYTLGQKSARKIVNLTHFRIMRFERFDLLNKTGLIELLNRWVSRETPIELQEFVIRNYQRSNAQLQQDLWALNHFMLNHNSDGVGGYFVEFGATDGVNLSNTYLLEKSFGWKGILCEPAQSFHQQLEENRTSIIDKRCVYSRSDSLIEFHEVKNRELSGIKDFHGIGGWKDEREDFISYPVKTVSLQDLLKSNGCPKVINYMSIDTEGSEFEIIKDFPFHEWNIECLSIEHNYSQNDFAIEELLAEKGFKRVCKSASRWDGWYIGRQI